MGSLKLVGVRPGKAALALPACGVLWDAVEGDQNHIVRAHGDLELNGSV